MPPKNKNTITAVTQTAISSGIETGRYRELAESIRAHTNPAANDPKQISSSKPNPMVDIFFPPPTILT